MARELTPDELRELLAVYALDAVDPEERAQVAAYLERSPDARREVAELQEAAALLASAAPNEAPDELWGRIEHALGAEPPTLVLPLDRERRGASRVSRRGRQRFAVKVAVGIAAASAVAAGVTAIVVSDEMSRQEERLDEVAARVERQDMRQAAEAAAADPHARTAMLEGSGGGAGGMVVAMPSGEAFVMAHGLPELAAGRTYQLWAVSGDPASPTPVSAGLLGRSLAVAAFHAPDGARGFLVTEEVAPGAVRMHGSPVLVGSFA
ncbi:MAG: anti-sigma factor [Acidimicrobiia bacterium]